MKKRGRDASDCGRHERRDDDAVSYTTHGSACCASDKLLTARRRSDEQGPTAAAATQKAPAHHRALFRRLPQRSTCIPRHVGAHRFDGALVALLLRRSALMSPPRAPQCCMSAPARFDYNGELLDIPSDAAALFRGFKVGGLKLAHNMVRPRLCRVCGRLLALHAARVVSVSAATPRRALVGATRGQRRGQRQRSVGCAAPRRAPVGAVGAAACADRLRLRLRFTHR